MCLALPNSYAQGEEVIAWTRMVIHFYCSVLAESVVFGLESTACSRLTPACLWHRNVKAPPTADEASGVFIAYCIGL